MSRDFSSMNIKYVHIVATIVIHTMHEGWTVEHSFLEITLILPENKSLNIFHHNTF